MKKIATIFSIILIIIIAYGVYSIKTNTDKITTTVSPQSLQDLAEDVQNIELDTIGNKNLTPTTPPADFIFGGWIPNWGMDKGLKSLDQNKAIINEISPVWYYVNKDGTLQNKRNAQSTQLEKLAIDNNIQIIPAIALFDHEIFTPILTNESTIDAHVNAIIKEVETYNYAGIDLDYESTKLDDKDNYFIFLEKLSKELHSRNKILYVTVLPKWTDLKVYASLPETRQVQDWSEISKYADKIRIMAYDYTYSKSVYPGPIAPLDWIEDILKYANTKADNDQFILGLHLYAYEWYSDTPTDLAFQPDISDDDFDSDKTARSYTYDTVLSALKKYSGENTEYQGEQIFTYEKNGEYRKLIYIDPAGLQQRVDLAKTYGLSGVVFWRYGGDVDLVTNLK